MKELGEFTLGRSLGRGASAQVFQAFRHGNPSACVALKVFHPAYWDREELRRRAMSEFRAISRLSHPSIVRVIEGCWDIEPPAVAFEYIDGGSLEQFQPRLPPHLPEVAALVVIEVLSALEHAHAVGVIHRDLKPANILVGNDGRVLVTDFGLAKLADVSQLTLSGTILGSPDFMAPEQARGDASTPKSDLFAAAAVLYFLVTGVRPFSRHSPLSTLAAVAEAEAEPPQLRNPKLGPELARILQKGLEKDPENRHASATEFRDQLRSCLAGLGLADAEFSFSRWMREPDATCLAAMKAKAAALCARAEGELARGEWNRFLEIVAHLSSAAPESADLPRLMAAYETRRRRSRFQCWAWRGAASATAAGLLGAGLMRIHWPRTETPLVAASPMPAISLAPPVAKLPVPEKPRPRKMAVVREAVPEPAAKPAPNPATTPEPPLLSKVEFDVPEEVSIFWNGVPVEPDLPLPPQPLGTYQLRLEKPGQRPIQQTIVVDSREPTLIRVR